MLRVYSHYIVCEYLSAGIDLSRQNLTSREGLNITLIKSVKLSILIVDKSVVVGILTVGESVKVGILIVGESG